MSPFFCALATSASTDFTSDLRSPATPLTHCTHPRLGNIERPRDGTPKRTERTIILFAVHRIFRQSTVLDRSRPHQIGGNQTTQSVLSDHSYFVENNPCLSIDELGDFWSSSFYQIYLLPPPPPTPFPPFKMAGYGMRGTPVLVQDGTDIDRRQCRRIVPMKVLVLGLCRTGTMCECRPLIDGRSSFVCLAAISPALLTPISPQPSGQLCGPWDTSRRTTCELPAQRHPATTSCGCKPSRPSGMVRARSRRRTGTSCLVTAKLCAIFQLPHSRQS